jgi:hypothetical protein
MQTEREFWPQNRTLREIHHQLVATNHRLERMETAFLNLAQQGLNKMSEMDDRLAELQADVTAESGAVDSAVTLIEGISQQIADAVAAAQAAGATPQQLQVLSDLDAAVKAKTQSLADAVAANTNPPSPPPGNPIP